MAKRRAGVAIRFCAEGRPKAGALYVDAVLSKGGASRAVLIRTNLCRVTSHVGPGSSVSHPVAARRRDGAGTRSSGQSVGRPRTTGASGDPLRCRPEVGPGELSTPPVTIRSMRISNANQTIIAAACPATNRT